MNVSELARQLKITTAEMLEKLPQLGFDIGRRAIKVDDRIAAKIIDAWKIQEKKDREMNRINEIRGVTGEIIEAKKKEIIELKVPRVIVVRELANLMNLPVNRLLVELMKNGVLISMNERIDFDTASIIGETLGYKILEDAKVSESEGHIESQKKLKDILKGKTGDQQPRPPVVVVMGHVDHGKTRLLDTIRKTDVLSTESGGITQHIGAYQVHRQNRAMTFIDTPGHEAFTAMRSRGARVADIAILVIAADDGIQLQTKEAIKIIQDAKLPFVVAINKIDKPDANIDKIKQQLSGLSIQPEDWGGNVPCVPVSAAKGTGIDDLLETILLIADMDKENYIVDSSRFAIGTIVESHVNGQEGAVATILVQAGTLKVGDTLGVGNNYYGKVRSLRDYIGKNVVQAGPGMPVKILGLKMAPEVGSIMEAAVDAKDLNRDIKGQKNKQEKDLSTLQRPSEEGEGKAKFVNLVIKTDVLGSLEAIIESLIKLETEEVKVKIVGKGLGMITEADVLRAETTGAKIFGFHVKPAQTVANLARDKKVEIKYYDVIYHLIEEVQKDMAALKEQKVARRLLGKLEVLKIFRQEVKSMIVGGRAFDGGLIITDEVVVMRKGVPITSGKVNRLECARQTVEKVSSGQECGLSFMGSPVVQVGDILEFYQKT